ncbi:MAG: hypothetical protein ABSB42_03615 [Tepidisphaeraceae bacterium]|jgi:hypothetical protein
MRKKFAFWALLGVVAAGCSSASSAVEGAFYSEHPYAHIDRSTTQSNADGSTSYEIAYTRADGTKATATYAPTGEIQKDQ